jgi:hypothetical protein
LSQPRVDPKTPRNPRTEADREMQTGKALILTLAVLTLAVDALAQSETGATPQEAIPTPRSVIGFEPGEDRKLADWSQIVDYFKKLDSASGRVTVHEPGLTTERRPFVYAIISSEENISNLSRIRANQRRLADPRLAKSKEELDRLIRETPAIVAITCSIHSTEIVASQMSMDLAYRLASDDSEQTAEILRNTVLILIPSVNPDGIDIVTNWYRKTLGTKYEGSNPPVLYHHYTGHDDNRDWFMLTQAETQIVSSLFWREWFPEIVYDVHQQGPYGSRMCVPPFFDPQNPNIDPVILREVGSIGMRMATKLDSLGFKGIVTNSTYDTWWHGGLRTAPYYHNAVGILTEAASVKIATPLEIRRGQLRSPTRGLQNPLVAQTNFPDPWEGGRWSARDIMNLELVTAKTALEEATLHREELIRNFVGAAQRSIQAGQKEGPFAYVVPAEQHDRPTADRMIEILIQQGVEVHRAREEFSADGKKYAKGSYVIFMSQPYRANVKCLFEAQKYPDRRLYPNGPAEPPYDVAGWTLPMQMGVAYAEAEHRFEGSFEEVQSTVTSAVRDKEPGVPERAIWMFACLSPKADNSYVVANELMKSPDRLEVGRLTQPFMTESRGCSEGSFTFEPRMPPKATKEAVLHDAVLKAAQDLDSARRASVASEFWFETFFFTRSKADSTLESRRLARKSLVKPRVALYRSWVPSMDEGWTRWVLEQFKFDYSTINDSDVRAGNLKDRFDVVILPDQSMLQMINGNRAGSYPEEFCGGMTEAGVTNLKSFVEAGGVLVCLDSASELAIKRFGLPVRNALEGLKRDQFYAPGSIFRARVDSQNPLAFGMPSEADLYFVSGTRRGRGSDPDISPANDSNPRPEGRGRGESNGSERAGDSQSGRRDESSTLVNAFAFEITDPQRAHSVVRYAEGNPLRSGWLLGPQYVAGKSALVDVNLGKGHVVLFGFRTQHRAQTWGTFKLLFNAILLGGIE